MTFISQKYTALSKLQMVCLKQKIPFVSYRLPLEKEIITLVQHQAYPEKLQNLDDLNDKDGFIIAPFTTSENTESYILKPDCVLLSNEIDTNLLDELADNKRFVESTKIFNTLETTNTDDFICNVNKAIYAFETTNLQKVVVSKVKVEQLPEKFEPEEFYLKLCEKYPHAFVYMLQFPEIGCWIGASPEPLLQIDNGIVKTVSLAGTQVATQTSIDDYIWSSKEIEEQEIVTNFVEQTLQDLKINNYTKCGPTNYQAGNLIHLMSSFEFTQNEARTNFSKLISNLHPTPSVGGLPQKEALNFILENEKHHRTYYTGFLGPININKKSAIFVNLRCLQIIGSNFVLYSGAGITSNSVAQREWEETDNKMMTMMNVMNSL